MSSVSTWEIALLVETGRIELDVPVERWVQRFLDRPGITGAPLTHLAAARSYQLNQFEHRDPADRLLIATAIELGCPLVTYDANILVFGKKRGRQHGFAVAAKAVARPRPRVLEVFWRHLFLQIRWLLVFLNGDLHAAKPRPAPPAGASARHFAPRLFAPGRALGH